MSKPTRKALEAQLAELQRQLAELQQPTTQQTSAAATETQPSGSGAMAQNGAAAGERGVAATTIQGPVATGDQARQVQSHQYIEQAKGPLIIAETGATVVVGDAPIVMSAIDRESALGRYLHHIIARNRYLQLQGIRSGGKLVHIELDRIYIRLRATQQRLITLAEDWLAEESALAPGERTRLGRHGLAAAPRLNTETVTVAVEEALTAHLRLVVLGDPGSGKTTLLRYMALLYARDLAEATAQVQAQLVAAEPPRLPILLPLRQVSSYLQAHADASTEGHVQLLAFLLRSLRDERIRLPDDFFDEWLTTGKAVILLDGLDEVADPNLRRRVAHLVERFTSAYAACRYVVTSRIVGYSGPARLSEDYTVTTVRDFTLADVERFLTNWHRLAAMSQMGAGESAEGYAAAQTHQLLAAIQANERIRDLAINPLMLTVIALVHRDRVKLPDRRAELYAEAVDVLLGKWEEAKGVQELPILPDKPFETNDKRLLLESLALSMHESEQKEIAVDDLRRLLATLFAGITGEQRLSEQAVNRFLDVIQERTGLLVARGEGVYAFSHLTFQEYLAARAVAGRDDYLPYTLSHLAAPWWREVILLTAGYLSTQSKERTTRLVRAIADQKEEPTPYYNLVLAAHCLRDIGGSRVEGNLEQALQQRLRTELETVLPKGWLRSMQLLLGKRTTVKALTERRIAAAQALAQIGGERYWAMPHGEPEWVYIPAGEFWMGEGAALHKLSLEAFYIARVPITNAQYHLFTQATGHKSPGHWEDHRPPKGLESYPVIRVAWRDAMAYCAWLSQATGKTITLPSEAQWERSARGPQDQRRYPWGEEFQSAHCNSKELGLNQTTPVGIFQTGASPEGCLDMAGNVWEWTRTLWGFDYPYDPTDGREDLAAGGKALRVLRGGSWYNEAGGVGCSVRDGNLRDYSLNSFGFRVVHCNRNYDSLDTPGAWPFNLSKLP